MNIVRTFTLILSFWMLSSCGDNKMVETKEIPQSITQKVDNALLVINDPLKAFNSIAIIDHHRMAKETGVYTPPSIAIIFSDSEVEIPLVKENQLVGLDLPFKVLCFSEPDTMNAKVAFTSGDFIQKRHNINPEIMAEYQSKMEKIISSYPIEMVSKTDISNVSEGFGIVNIQSELNFDSTISNLKSIVMSQGDTKWFGDINYQKEAASMNIELRPTVLLLFGAPLPGGKAMVTFPKIGLDAFCQKLLVYEKENGEVWIAYNNIVDFAELYYQSSTKPQQMINERLKMTFTKAVSLPDSK
ncbi:MAG: DUF302 domain-containing protein [Salibacteraceae bacterium]